jgi:hypothetical protein
VSHLRWLNFISASGTPRFRAGLGVCRAYILVLLGLSGALVAAKSPKHDSLKLILTAALVAVGFLLASFVGAKFNLESRYVSGVLVALFILMWAVSSRPVPLIVFGYLARRKQR